MNTARNVDLSMTQRESAKCSLACEYCRIKKAKCSGTQPCGNCIDHKEECIFPEKRPRTRKRKEREQEMENRLSKMEALLRAATQGTMSDTGSVTVPDGPPAAARARWERGASEALTSSTTAEVIQHGASPISPIQSGHLQHILTPACPGLPMIMPQPSSYDPAELHRGLSESTADNTVGVYGIDPLSWSAELQAPVSPPSSTAPDSCITAVLSERESLPQGRHAAVTQALEKESSDMSDDSMTCASYLSICSFPATEWVSRQSGMLNFLASARRLSKAVSRGERLDRVIGPVRAPEPDLETALRFTKAYFDNCLDSIFEIVDRQQFEARLRQHFAGGAESKSSKEWYAMRNAVYASGCRYLISEARSPEAFSQSRAKSWEYLENALSVHTDLLFGSSDLVGVQALLLMAFHAEALGTPALEFMLLSSATRLAQSKGLHLRECFGTHVSHEEKLSRQLLWWTIYSYEKHLCYRSGVPSAIDDEFITCPIPTRMRCGSKVSLDFFTSTVYHAQISSKVSKMLSSAKAKSDSPITVLANVRDLDRQLQRWRQSLPPVYQTEAPFKPTDSPPGTQIHHILYLHFCYHVQLIAIHGVFCYPWSRLDINTDGSPEIRQQIQESTKAVAEASRQIILAIQRVEITAALPVWLTFYYPLVGLINLFICSIKDPHSPTASSDLSLLDLVVGHFGYLDWMTSSELNLAFPREATAYARDFVLKAKQEAASSKLLASQNPGVGRESPLPHSLVSADMTSFDVFLGTEDWCNFLPPMPQSLFTADSPFGDHVAQLMQPPG